MNAPMKNCFFNGANIRVPLQGPGIDSKFPESLPVADLRTDAMRDVAELMATGHAMAAAGEMLEALLLVAQKFGSRPYGTGSYIQKPIRDKVFSAVKKATGQKDGA